MIDIAYLLNRVHEAQAALATGDIFNAMLAINKMDNELSYQLMKADLNKKAE